MFAKFAAIVAVVAALAGVAQIAPATATEDAPASVSVEVADIHWASNPIHRTLWIATTLEEANVVVPANVEILVTDEKNCGSEISPDKTGGGCTEYPTVKGGKTIVRVSPTALENGTGGHILFHELGHAIYHLDECAAEYFAHNYSDPNQWSYLECKQ